MSDNEWGRYVSHQNAVALGQDPKKPRWWDVDWPLPGFLAVLTMLATLFITIHVGKAAEASRASWQSVTVTYVGHPTYVGSDTWPTDSTYILDGLVYHATVDAAPYGQAMPAGTKEQVWVRRHLGEVGPQGACHPREAEPTGARAGAAGITSEG